MLSLVLLLGMVAGSAPPHGVEWTRVAPGMELVWLAARQPSIVGDSKILVVRIDPDLWQLELVGRSTTGDAEGGTAREWADGHGLSAAVNAGMFGHDYTTHVGYMESNGHVNSSVVNHYQSVAAFDPRDPAQSPPFRIFDLDQEGITIQGIRHEYGSLVQNLRLVKRPGENRWGIRDQMWSEAALGEDRDGRILFVFCRSPFEMRDLNRELLSAGIGLVALQHLEGGPEAQLYLHAEDTELELFGSYETSFNENDENRTPWPIPNVLGIKRRLSVDSKH